MNMAVMEPELETELEEGDVDEQDDNNDGDQPGWLVTYVDGKQPELVRLDGTVDDGLDQDSVWERFDQADKSGHRFFKLGNWRGRLDLIRSMSWSEDVDLPELVAYDSLQDRVEDILDAAQEAMQARAQTEQGMLMLQEQMAGLQAATAQLLELEMEVEVEAPKAPKAAKPAPAPLKQPMGKLGKGKLPPGINPGNRS